ncbi:heterodisulfide reductase-related iron-sulfur binding cluster [Brevibacterium sp. ZH18]|uniref:(Fe-S)-binding protein n=1 Tax=Brevibacterium sp. ZH18 TaxID=2927784 RepID=UPI001F6118E6|nr:heterodisulfide reductase-related iron-sulfur binding cluster [Brevibacterium sp. ZH18]MCI4011863.1 4Fe-4S dicluster domain-containing protein [Brevibacterium sp. ZH18]
MSCECGGAGGCQGGAAPSETTGPTPAEVTMASAGQATMQMAPPAIDHSAFDVFNPPDPSLISDCVHCGFCLPACPTYQLWGREEDSPRGRIYLMQEGLENGPMNAAMVEHFDACLGCMACVTACPSGVQYDKLIEATRGQVERNGKHHRSRAENGLREAIFQLFPYPDRLKALLGPLKLYQRTGLSSLVRKSKILERLSPTLATMEAIAPPVTRNVTIPEVSLPRTAEGQALPVRSRVGMLLGCVQRTFYPQVNAATARVLNMEGCEVVVPKSQGCCGALSVHAGRAEEGEDFARRIVDTFESAEVDYLVVNSAGCGSTMKEYADILANDPLYADRAEVLAGKVRDVTEILVELGPEAPRHPVADAAGTNGDLRVAYHDACHLSHAQGVRNPPRELLGQIPGLEIAPIRDADTCCGSAGIYNLVRPEAARELGDKKATNIAATKADLVVTGNPGCLLQVTDALRRRGEDTLPTAHTIELLDASLTGAGASDLLSR